MGRLVVRAVAEAAVDEIAAAIARENLRAALRFYDRVEETLSRIARWPAIGSRHQVRDPSLRGLRSYPIRSYRNYLVFYLPLDSGDGVEVIHVVHGARDVDSVLRRR